MIVCVRVPCILHIVDVIMVDKTVVVYKHINDVFLFVVGGSEENELILSSLISCFEDTLQALFNGDANSA